jgi:DNA-directed RNA polymerase specialized sigma24 family protein
MPTKEPDRPRSDAGQFRSTHWENVLAARDPADPEAGRALAELCRTYWYPLYAFARRKGSTPEQAEDLTQGFFSDGLARDFLRSADPARGRFRTFLLAAFEHYVGHQRAREKRVKRGGRVATVSLEGGGAEARYLREPVHSETAERLYDRRWAMTVLDRALDRLERRMTEQGKAPLFDRLKPALLGAEDAVGHARVGEELGMTEGAVKVAAHRMRARLSTLIRDEVAQTVADPSQIDDEIRDLFSVLGS